MRLTGRSAASILIVLLLGACGSAPAVSAENDASPPAAPPAEAPKAPPAVPGASGTLAKVAGAYRGAPALTDEVIIEQSGTQGTMRDEISVTLGPGTDARVERQGFVFTADGDMAYLHRRTIADKYFARPLEGDLVGTFKDMAPLPLPHMGLRSGTSEDDQLEALGLSLTSGVVLLEENETEVDGKRYIELHFEDRNSSSIRALVDPETMLLARVTLMSRFSTLEARMSPTVHGAPPEPIDFDTAGRRRVQAPQQLVLGAGDMAPDFELSTLDGERVRLSDLRGSVVVLDFWGTWCRPCRMSMPLLDQFARWAQDSDMPVEVIAVAGERVPGREQQDALVRRYWNQAGYVMTNVMDYTKAVSMQFDVTGVPYTVVVGPDGRILSVKTGYDRNIVAHLQMLTKEALEG